MEGPSPAAEQKVSVGMHGKSAPPGRQAVRYGLHVLMVYAIVHFTPMWLAGRVHDAVLPLVQHHPPTVSYFQFGFSNLFYFSFFPAAVIGFLYAVWFRHYVALFVWIVPLALLAYKFATFPASVMENHFTMAFHQYFAGGFLIPEYHSYEELFQLAGSNPDMPRGMQQLRYTAPLYAAIGYSIGAWLPIRFRFTKLDAALRSMKPTLRRSNQLS